MFIKLSPEIPDFNIGETQGAEHTWSVTLFLKVELAQEGLAERGARSCQCARARGCSTLRGVPQRTCTCRLCLDSGFRDLGHAAYQTSPSWKCIV